MLAHQTLPPSGAIAVPRALLSRMTDLPSRGRPLCSQDSGVTATNYRHQFKSNAPSIGASGQRLSRRPGTPAGPEGFLMSLIGLAQHLREGREEIVTCWLQTVLATAHKAPASRGLQQVALRNHIPLLLQEIEGAIAGEATPEVDAEAREHGTQRWGHGFFIDEVIGELSALRLVLLGRIEKYAASSSALSPAEAGTASKRLVDVIDRTARAS